MISDIWTVGHSTRSLSDFIDLLKSFSIAHLVDIRTYPGSRRFPHFNKENLERSLRLEGIKYSHMPELGGRRKPRPDSANTAWRHNAFRGYADHMSTEEFAGGIKTLEELARREPLVYMCSEAMWWKCHRALVSDYLKAAGWNVFHIMDRNKAPEHPYTSPAKPVQGRLFY